MNQTDVQDRLADISRKLDVVMEEIEQQRRHRREMGDFLQDFSPVARQLVLDLMERLDELDRKGYFAFLKEFSRVADAVVTSFTVDDVKHLGDNIVTILNTVKSLTQPDMLRAINNAVVVYKNLDTSATEDVSLLGLLRDLNSPEARRGLAFTIRFLKSVAVQPAPAEPNNGGLHTNETMRITWDR